MPVTGCTKKSEVTILLFASTEYQLEVPIEFYGKGTKKVGGWHIHIIYASTHVLGAINIERT